MRLLDIARGQYVRSPAWVRRSVGPAISLLSTRLQYGGGYAAWRKDIERGTHDAAFVAARRLAEVRNLYRLSIEKSPFWRERFEKAFDGRLPDVEAFHLAHVSRLPVLTRSDLVAHGAAMLTAPASELDQASTSGSSGTPVRFYLDKDRSPKEIAFVNHNWGQCGYREGKVKAVFRGLPFERHEKDGYYWEPALRELRLSPWTLTAERMERYVALLEQYEAEYLYGYPSCLEILSRYIASGGRAPRADLVKALFPISEPVYPHQRALFKRVFPQAKLVPQYGMSERVAFGSAVLECDDHYDFEPLYGYTEIVDPDGAPMTEAGRVGRIVSTGFLSKGMPLWRYDTGDSARLVRAPTAETMYRLRVCEIVPRTSSAFLVGREGQRIDLHWFAQSDPASFTGISEYQFHQEKPGIVTVRIVPAAAATDQQLARFVAGMQASVGGAIELVATRVAALEQNERGKRKLSIQKLDATPP